MAKHTLKILRCYGVHTARFLKFGHFTTLCTKGLKQSNKNLSYDLFDNLHIQTLTTNNSSPFTSPSTLGLEIQKMKTESMKFKNINNITAVWDRTVINNMHWWKLKFNKILTSAFVSALWPSKYEYNASNASRSFRVFPLFGWKQGRNPLGYFP